MHDPPSITALVNAAPVPGPALAKVVPLAPVSVYLARLGSPKSRRTMRAALATVAAALGAASPHAIPWGALRYPHVAALRARFAERRAPASVNKLLSAVRDAPRPARRYSRLDIQTSDI